MLPKAQDDDLVMSLVESALALPAAERREHLERACGGDAELFQAVWNYVESARRMSGFLLDPLYPPLDPDRPFHPGDVLENRFRIVREVAQGGMGIVYEAIDERLDRRIALKCAKPGFHNRLSPEIRNATEISHPNVCKLFEIHTAATSVGSVDFLTMEFLDGETLGDRLRRGSLPEDEARSIALDLCAGLAEAHRRQVIHGDLKSNNVILAREPDGSVRAVLTDFGLARKPEWVQAGRPGSQVGGTPDYMAPELWKGAKASAASDIYALGVILREIASAQGSGDRSERETVSAARGPWAGLERMRGLSRSSSLRTKWARVIARCVEAEPAKRYASASDVARALTPQRRRWVAASAAAVVLVAASGVATYETVTAPEQSVRLVALPFTASPAAVPTAERLYVDVSSRLTTLRGDERTSLVVVSPSRALADTLVTPAKARDALRVTHVLRANLRNENGGFTIQARLTDTRSLADVRQWTGVYSVNELRYAPVALAGMMTESLHVPPVRDLATVNAGAKQDYMSGLWHLRRNSGIDLALPLLKRAVAADPDSALTHSALAEGLWWKYLVTGDRSWLGPAGESLDAAERRNPDVAEVRRAAGLLKSANGQYEQAENDYVRAIELEPANSDAYRRLGVVYDSMNEHEKALTMYRRAVELEPNYHRNYLALAIYYRERGDYREALQSFRKSAELEPNEPLAHTGLGYSYYSLGQFVDAERELRLALDLGETEEALEMLGLVLTYERREQESILFFKRALERSPDNYHLWLNLGTAYRRLNLRTDAERAYRRGLVLAESEMAKNPRDGYVRACLAYLSARLGDAGRAESEAAQALQLTPRNSDTRRMAVKTYEALGRRDESLAVLATSARDVIIDLSRYPDMADLQRDPRFVQLLMSDQEK